MSARLQEKLPGVWAKVKSNYGLALDEEARERLQQHHGYFWTNPENRAARAKLIGDMVAAIPTSAASSREEIIAHTIMLWEGIRVTNLPQALVDSSSLSENVQGQMIAAQNYAAILQRALQRLKDSIINEICGEIDQDDGKYNPTIVDLFGTLATRDEKMMETVKVSESKILSELSTQKVGIRAVQGRLDSGKGIAVDSEKMATELAKRLPKATNVDLAPVVQKVDTLAARLQAQEDARKAKIAERELEAEKRRVKAAEDKVLREKAKAEEAALKKQRRDENIARRKAKKDRQRAVRQAKAKGENPYTPEETQAFVKKLEAKGKTYYTPEQRLAHKVAVRAEKRKIRGFVVRTPQEIEAYKLKLAAEGKKYYSPAERRAHKARVAKKDVVPSSGDTTPKASSN